MRMLDLVPGTMRGEAYRPEMRLPLWCMVYNWTLAASEDMEMEQLRKRALVQVFGLSFS